jgi:hypothetical protein
MAGLRAALAGVAVCLAAAPAAGQGWTSQLQFSQRLGFDTNFGLDEDEEPALTSLTTLGLGFTRSTEATTLRLAPGFSYSASTDEGAAFEGFDDVNPRFRGSIDHRRPRLTLGGSASVVPRIVDGVSFGSEDLIDPDAPFEPEEPPIEDPGRDDDLERGRAIRIDSTATGRASYRLDSLNTASLTVSANRTDYDRADDALRERQSYGLGASWSRPLDSLTSVSASLNYRRFETLDGLANESDTVTPSLGFSRRLGPDFRFGLDLGAAFVSQTREQRVGDATVSEDTSDVSFSGGLDVSYGGLGTRDTRFSFGADQSTLQDSQGELVNRSTLRASASYDIDQVSGVGLSTRLFFDTPVISGDADDSRSFVASAFYRRSLTEDWQARVGYSLRVREDDEDDAALSNLFFLQISRAFDLF